MAIEFLDLDRGPWLRLRGFEQVTKPRYVETALRELEHLLTAGIAGLPQELQHGELGQALDPAGSIDPPSPSVPNQPSFEFCRITHVGAEHLRKALRVAGVVDPLRGEVGLLGLYFRINIVFLPDPPD